MRLVGRMCGEPVGTGCVESRSEDREGARGSPCLLCGALSRGFFPREGVDNRRSNCCEECVARGRDEKRGGAVWTGKVGEVQRA